MWKWNAFSYTGTLFLVGNSLGGTVSQGKKWNKERREEKEGKKGNKKKSLKGSQEKFVPNSLTSKWYG